MSKNRESEPATSSVIARLMCLDEHQSQQLVSRQKKKQTRVLSENYLRKVASIGAWETKKCSFDKGNSFRLSNVENREFKDTFKEMESLKSDKGSDTRKGCYRNRIANGVAIDDRSRNRTIGQMLALPDHAKRGNVRGPSSISSRNGWKNEGVGDLIKSRPRVYSTSFGSPYMTMSPVFPWSRRMSMKHVSNGKDCPKQRNSGSNYKRTQSSPDLESEKSTEDHVVHESSVFSDASPSIASEHVESTGSITSEEDCDRSVCTSDAWSQQPSPVSVLEAQFAEGNSLSSKCFLSITASLNDVKRQLECIKSESIEEYSEGSGMIVSSDDENDAGEKSLHDCEVNEYAKKLDFSYLVDVLTEAGFRSTNPNILSNRWHTPETPISISIFDTLEKKYGEWISWKRSDRRLLFDCINSGLTKMLQPCLGDPVWKQSVARRFSYSLNSNAIEKELYMLLVSQEHEAKKNSSEKLFTKDDGWLSLGYEIEMIGREIENSLIDELAFEIVSL